MTAHEPAHDQFCLLICQTSLPLPLVNCGLQYFCMWLLEPGDTFLQMRFCSFIQDRSVNMQCRSIVGCGARATTIVIMLAMTRRMQTCFRFSWGQRASQTWLDVSATGRSTSGAVDSICPVDKLVVSPLYFCWHFCVVNLSLLVNTSVLSRSLYQST